MKAPGKLGAFFMTPQVYVSIAASLIAAIIAIWGVITQRVIARRRATIDYITRQQSDGDLILARQKFIELSKDAAGLAHWAAEANENTEQAGYIRLVMNEHELIAIAIQKGVIDYGMYKRWNKSSTIKYWNHGAPFVMALRHRLGNPAIFHEFEELVGWLLDKENKMPKRTMWKGKWF